MIGAATGLSSVVIGALARTIQHWLYALPTATRLSSMPLLPLGSLLILPAGGATLAVYSWATRARSRRLHLTKASQPAGLILRDTLRHVIGGLAWIPRRPGATLRRESIPIVLAVSLCLSVVARQLLGRVRRRGFDRDG